MNEKRFRQDLLYRLHDFAITVPPLRDCQEDIMPLAAFFRDMANRELELSLIHISSIYRMATAFFSSWAALIKIYSYRQFPSGQLDG